MKIIDVFSLKIEDIKVIRFARFKDHRGYFSEIFRVQDIEELDFLKGYKFYQANESFSKENVIRGLHLQWNPYMGKLVRTIKGRMIDLALDIRKNSPTLGKIVAYDMPASTERDYSEWIWIPPGFAHGNIFTEETMIEYFCTGWWSPDTEAAISPLSDDIDWSFTATEIIKTFQNIKEKGALMSEKDRKAFSLKEWLSDERSQNFLYGMKHI